MLYENIAVVKLVSTTFYLYEISQFTSVCVYVNLSFLIITKPHVVQSGEVDSERLGAEVDQQNLHPRDVSSLSKYSLAWGEAAGQEVKANTCQLVSSFLTNPRPRK